MLKRQDSLLSSSRRETPPQQYHHAKAVGCMPGIIDLIFKYQKKNKRLTSGRKHEKSAVSSPKKAKVSVITQASPSAIEYDYYNKLDHEKTFDTTRRLSCDIVPRSPTLPPEIRRSNAICGWGTHRAQPTLVARLMGLEENPKGIFRSTQVEESTEEKRKKLLQALEKCNEDLEALKNVIEAVQSAGKRVQPPRMVKRTTGVQGGDATPKAVETCMKRCAEANSEQQLSPVYVLDECIRSPLRTYFKVNTNGRETQLRKSTPKKNPRDADNMDTCFFRKTIIDSCQIKRETTSLSTWSSKAMIGSVDEVCRDIAWGEKREVGRIGLMLQDYICRELIDETVRELASYHMYVLPFEACKRRLCF